MSFTSADVILIRSAASLAEHSPERMRAAHLVGPLEELAARVAALVPKEEPEIRPAPLELPRAA